MRSYDQRYLLISWILSGAKTALILHSNNKDKLHSFINGIKTVTKIEVYSKLNDINKRNILRNLINKKRTVFIIQDLEYAVKTYLRSVGRDNSGTYSLARLQPQEIIDFVNEFDIFDLDIMPDIDWAYIRSLTEKIKHESTNKDYLVELLTLYSDPGVFIGYILDEIKYGKYTWKLSTDVPNNTPIFRLSTTGKTYINIDCLISNWDKLFGYKCVWNKLDIKRWVWKITKRSNMRLLHSHNRYREFKNRI